MKIDPSGLDRLPVYKLLTSSVIPRPIAFVSTVGEKGCPNLAPFSFFTTLCARPPILGFSCGRRKGEKKDTLRNIELTRDFVVNIVTDDLAEAMNQSSAEFPYGVDEFKEVGLTAVPSDRVKSPRLFESPVNMECRLMQVLEFGKDPDISSFIIGEVVFFHVRDELLENGYVNMHELKALGRLGSELYCRTKDIFEMKRPYPYPH
ncbi:MAG: flavin reductase family protein [Chloroflexi bacterium]|nr:flavin reductase family protein [Chloroflexota bacterium]